MIDSYFDRADAALGYKRRESAPIWEDPRFYNGQLYSTMIDRNVAEARDRLAGAIDRAVRHHLWEIRLGVKLGSDKSIFRTERTV